jgi:hypothetical protein
MSRTWLGDRRACARERTRPHRARQRGNDPDVFEQRLHRRVDGAVGFEIRTSRRDQVQVPHTID